MRPFVLPPPARYFPLKSGRYEVTPGLKPLGAPLGNGDADAHLFQIDTGFSRYRENKLRCRAERLGKYVVFDDFTLPVAAAVARFLAMRLCAEYPDLFISEPDADGSCALTCRLTGERLAFDPQMRLLDGGSGPQGAPAYGSAFDALCCQVQEDIAVVRTLPGRGDWIAALHLCSPSHWGAEQKIGRSFVDAHAPVPGMEKVNAAAASLVEAMVHRGPFVRFVWGVGADDRLNHHPHPPPGVGREAWRGRAFDPAASPPFFLRVERQALWGLPDVGAALFTIRVSFVDGEEIRARPAERAQLRSALLSMSPASRVYKGVAGCVEEIVRWLDGGA